MSPTDEFTACHQELLDGVYDCVDRIVLNAYFSPASSPGGFRNWWRRLTGSDDTLDEAHLQRMAGRFGRRLAAYARKHGIPFIRCESGERRRDAAESYLPVDAGFTGLFLILVGRAPAPVWEVQRFGRGGVNLKGKKKRAHVNHYYFHLMDPEWGHVTVTTNHQVASGAEEDRLLTGREGMRVEGDCKGFSAGTRRAQRLAELSHGLGAADTLEALRVSAAFASLR